MSKLYPTESDPISNWLWDLTYAIQRVILLGLTAVLTGISLKTELRFKSYGRLMF